MPDKTVLLKKHCVAELSDVIAEVGTTVLGRVKANVSMGVEDSLPSSEEEEEWW